MRNGANAHTHTELLSSGSSNSYHSHCPLIWGQSQWVSVAEESRREDQQSSRSSLMVRCLFSTDADLHWCLGSANLMNSLCASYMEVKSKSVLMRQNEIISCCVQWCLWSRLSLMYFNYNIFSLFSLWHNCWMKISIPQKHWATLTSIVCVKCFHTEYKCIHANICSRASGGCVVALFPVIKQCVTLWDRLVVSLRIFC